MVAPGSERWTFREETFERREWPEQWFQLRIHICQVRGRKEDLQPFHSFGRKAVTEQMDHFARAVEAGRDHISIQRRLPRNRDGDGAIEAPERLAWPQDAGVKEDLEEARLVDHTADKPTAGAEEGADARGDLAD